MVSLKNSLFWFFLLLAFTCGTFHSEGDEPSPPEPAVPGGVYFECQIDPTSESNFSLALFRVWLPESTTPIKGVLTVLPGSDADGTPIANDPHWQVFAANWNYALLGTTFTTRPSAPPYYRAESGSGQALLAALDQLGTASGHPELKNAPIAILGHSQGGQFAFHLTCWKPARVLTFATIKGGYYDATPTEAARAVPGLLITADEDAEFRRKNIRALFDANSTTSARWAFAAEPKAGHELGCSLQLIVPFFEAVIRGDRQPCYGNLQSLTFHPAAPLGEAGQPWFPHRDVAEIWSRFMRGTLLTSRLALNIPSPPLPVMAQVSPSTYDFGTLSSRDASSFATFHVKPSPNGPQWTSLRAYSPESRCEVSVAESDNDWILTIKPNLARLPLGRLRDTIHLRYLENGRPINGGTELVVALNHAHPDIKLSASSLYVGVHAQTCQQTLIFTAPTNKRLKIRSIELLTGTRATAAIENQTDGATVIVFTFSPLREAGSHSGTFAVHLEEPLATTVVVPFMGFYSPLGASTKTTAVRPQ